MQFCPLCSWPQFSPGLGIAQPLIPDPCPLIPAPCPPAPGRQILFDPQELPSLTPTIKPQSYARTPRWGKALRGSLCSQLACGMLQLNVPELVGRIEASAAFCTVGRLLSSREMLSARMPAAVGQLCRLESTHGQPMLAEVVGVHDGVAHMLPLRKSSGLPSGARVVGLGRSLRVPTGPGLLGRVLDGLGEPIDGRGPVRAAARIPLHRAAPAPLDRPKIAKPFVTGQRAIDGLLTFGQGQRVGLFAGSGVGKSTLLGEIAKQAESDVNVIALVGERGREVRPFLDDCLGPEGRQRSVVLVSTSEETPLMKVRCAEAAVAIADSFRRQGANVLLLMDSVTRLATSQREVGLMLGEPPSARGYTPSVFQLLATTLEQLGCSSQGAITAIVTVLVDGDDLDEPISDAVRSIVDGHIVLDRRLAEQSHFPAINIARSISRVMRDVASAEHQAAASKIRTALAVYDDAADLIRVGAYAKGGSVEVDRAMALMPALLRYLRQDVNTVSSWRETMELTQKLGAAWGASP